MVQAAVLRRVCTALRGLAGKLAFLPLAACCVAAPAQQPVLEQLRGAGVLRVGTTGDYPPFSYRDPRTGEFLGSDVEQARALAARLGLQLEVVQTSWRTLLADQAAGRFDIAMGGISVTPERARQAAFSRPYLADGKTPLVRCADLRRYTTLAHIDQARVRVIENPGGTNEAFARARLPHAQLQVHGDNRGVFDELLAGRADVMITDAIEARLQQQLRPGLCAVHPAHPFDHSAKAYLLPRDAAFRLEVDRWLGDELTSGRAQARLDRWLHHAWPVTVPPPLLLAGLVDERLALMPDVARYKWNHGQPIEDLPREQALLDAVRGQALQHGVAPERAVAFFAAQIEASKVLQRELFERWRGAGLGPFESVRDLATEIRPRLDALNPRLLTALATLEGVTVRENFGVPAATAVSPAAVEVALAPLVSPPGVSRPGVPQ